MKKTVSHPSLLVPHFFDLKKKKKLHPFNIVVSFTRFFQSMQKWQKKK
jgi:hypothetical protein